MPTFRVTILGVGDAFTERHHPTALLLEHDGFRLDIDCPDSYREALRNATSIAGHEVRLEDIDDFLITHVHGDHMNGLEGAAFFKRYAEKKRLRLVTSREVRNVIWDERLKAPMGVLWDGKTFNTMSFDSYFDFTELSWSNETVIGPFTIRARQTKHHVPTSALMIEAGGRVLGYSADTAFDPELIAFLKPADLIIHETNLGVAHTPYAKLAALPETLRAKMRLIHYADSFDKQKSKIVPLNEGDVLFP
jgi:ribonuclease BN (tRNA processing enzyme)